MKLPPTRNHRQLANWINRSGWSTIAAGWSPRASSETYRKR